MMACLPERRSEISSMKQQLGFLLQLAALAGLPVVSYCELVFKMHILTMPAAILAAVILFGIGGMLRNSK